MNVKDFKRKTDDMFPCRWENDFLQELNKTFKNYIDIVSSLDNIDKSVLDDIKELCAQLMEVVNCYYDGRKSEAFIRFREIMNGCDNRKGLFLNISSIDINEGEFYYRARKRECKKEFTIQDMFHIPLNKRGIVSTQRYSSPGFPCLYLGNSVYSCWEELRRPPFDNLMFSAFKVRSAFKVFDMRVPDDSDYASLAILSQTIRRIPLVLACSFIVKNPSDVFKPEYIIPQFLIDTIIENSKRITRQEKSILDPNVIWGVVYTSTHISHDFPYGRKFLENIVLPVVESNNSANYCYYLASLFEISQPVYYEYESLKEDTACVCREFGNQEKTNVKTIREQYKTSKMGYIEEKLKNVPFPSLPYLVLGLPANNTIELDYTGKTKSFDIHTNQSFIIE